MPNVYKDILGATPEENYARSIHEETVTETALLKRKEIISKLFPLLCTNGTPGVEESRPDPSAKHWPKYDPGVCGTKDTRGIEDALDTNDVDDSDYIDVKLVKCRNCGRSTIYENYIMDGCQPKFCRCGEGRENLFTFTRRVKPDARSKEIIPPAER